MSRGRLACFVLGGPPLGVSIAFRSFTWEYQPPTPTRPPSPRPLLTPVPTTSTQLVPHALYPSPFIPPVLAMKVFPTSPLVLMLGSALSLSTLVHGFQSSPTFFLIDTPSKTSPWVQGGPNPLIWESAKGESPITSRLQPSKEGRVSGARARAVPGEADLGPVGHRTTYERPQLHIFSAGI